MADRFHNAVLGGHAGLVEEMLESAPALAVARWEVPDHEAGADAPPSLAPLARLGGPGCHVFPVQLALLALFQVLAQRLWADAEDLALDPEAAEALAVLRAVTGAARLFGAHRLRDPPPPPPSPPSLILPAWSRCPVPAELLAPADLAVFLCRVAPGSRAVQRAMRQAVGLFRKEGGRVPTVPIHISSSALGAPILWDDQEGQPAAACADLELCFADAGAAPPLPAHRAVLARSGSDLLARMAVGAWAGLSPGRVDLSDDREMWRMCLEFLYTGRIQDRDRDQNLPHLVRRLHFAHYTGLAAFAEASDRRLGAYLEGLGPGQDTDPDDKSIHGPGQNTDPDGESILGLLELCDLLDCPAVRRGLADLLRRYLTAGNRGGQSVRAQVRDHVLHRPEWWTFVGLTQTQ